MPSLTSEIYYLILITLFCGLLWVPYVIERFFRMGIKETCGYGDKNINISTWASRAKLAHSNLTENLPLFAILIILISILELNNQQTETGSIIFFYSRILHYFTYIFAIPFLRTFLFLASWIGLLLISLPLLSIVF
ncbi:MAG: hypothetical protein CMN37_07670 [SAR116 cluster bacterium]|nr:hypothetical protein [SAR116 cluster bacterium]|tara:strand:+ start:1572 stop:1979 length:408 start_codon:yes stop_codon:yes gene_type:complete